MHVLFLGRKMTRRRLTCNYSSKLIKAQFSQQQQLQLLLKDDLDVGLKGIRINKKV